jgi:uncharacterized protein (DUF305 family)
MLSPGEIEGLRRAEPAGFDPLFVRLMSQHHEGAIAMSSEALAQAGDPRLKLMAHAIRHQQSGEIQLMHGVQGVPAVKAAVAALFTPAHGPRNRPAPPHSHR